MSLARPLLGLSLAATFSLGGLAQASEARFRDGEREVLAERIGPEASDARGRLLTPVRLHYQDGRSVPAQVDRTAIVRIAHGEEARVTERGGKLVRALAPSLGMWLVEDTTGGDGIDLAWRMHDLTGVVHAVPNLYLEHRATADPYTPTDPKFGDQWYFRNLDMPEAWGITLGASSTTVVVIDTGCDLAHPDLVAKLDDGLDVVSGDMDPSYVAGENAAAHGTECAGLIGADTDNDEGIAGGCPECRLRCVRLISDAAIPLAADIDAFQFALDVNAAVVSNSWGFTTAMPVPQPLADIITELATHGRDGKGALVLFAAGNDDRDIGDDELQAVDGVFCVGAINNFDESTPFTNRGNSLDAVVPTGTVTTDISGADGDDPGDYTSLFGGTSSACPVAAGIAGLLASAAPEKTSAELYDAMIRTTRPAPFAVPDGNGHDTIYGFGIIQPADALRDALGLGGDGGAGGMGAGGAPAGGGGETDAEGCSCSTPGQRTSHGAILFVATAAFAAMHRRRGRAAFFTSRREERKVGGRI
jgi:serine protease